MKPVTPVTAAGLAECPVQNPNYSYPIAVDGVVATAAVVGGGDGDGGGGGVELEDAEVKVEALALLRLTKSLTPDAI